MTKYASTRIFEPSFITTCCLKDYLLSSRVGVQVLDLQMSAGSSSAERLRRKGATVGSRPR
eukprot:COSAG01_NODE_63024_length_281_cov_3.961538_1_plen_60_part_10